DQLDCFLELYNPLYQKPVGDSTFSATQFSEKGEIANFALLVDLISSSSWDPDQPGEETLGKAQDVIRELQLDIDATEAFVPGKRRGYAILPFAARRGESGDDARRRVMKAVQRVRAANVILGRREDGQHSRLWLAISQSPAKRKRAQLAAKTKRLILELGGAASRLEVEYSTGTAWYNGGRVCSGTAPKQGEDAVEAGAGWIDLPKIARNLGMSEEHEGGSVSPGSAKPMFAQTLVAAYMAKRTVSRPERTLIDEFTDKHFTWITRPLLQTTDAEGGHTFYDTHLQRKYTKAEAEQVQRELGEAEAQKQIRQKARQLLRYYRINDRHPQKLIMNLAYDEHSVDALLEEARDRWGNTPEVGGSEEEDEEPTDVLQFWHEWGDCPLKSPHLDWDDDDDNWVPIAKTRGRRKATFAAEQTSFEGDKPGQAPTEGDRCRDEF
ncbi:Catsper1, partial [Symbiodinium sp. KB8]